MAPLLDTFLTQEVSFSVCALHNNTENTENTESTCHHNTSRIYIIHTETNIASNKYIKPKNELLTLPACDETN